MGREIKRISLGKPEGAYPENSKFIALNWDNCTNPITHYMILEK